MLEFLGQSVTLITGNPIASLVTAGTGIATLFTGKIYYDMKNAKKANKQNPPSPKQNPPLPLIPEKSLREKWLETIQLAAKESLDKRIKKYFALQEESEKLTQSIEDLKKEYGERQQSHEKEMNTLNDQIEKIRDIIATREKEADILRKEFEEEEERHDRSDFNVTLTIPSDAVKALKSTHPKLPKQLQAEVYQSLLQQLEDKEKAQQSLVETHKKKLNELQILIDNIVEEKNQVERQLLLLREKAMEGTLHFEQTQRTFIGGYQQNAEGMKKLEETPIVVRATIPTEILGKQGGNGDYHISTSRSYVPLLDSKANNDQTHPSSSSPLIIGSIEELAPRNDSLIKSNKPEVSSPSSSSSSSRRVGTRKRVLRS